MADKNVRTIPPSAKGNASKRLNKQPAKPMSFTDTIKSWAKTIITSLLIVMVLNGLLIASFVVPTGSMENEVMAGDFVFVNKFIYGGSSPQTIPFLETPLPFFRLPGLRDPEKNDVIVFIFPGNRDQVKADQFQYYLKRCVATAGDTLQVVNNELFVNGQKAPVPPHAKFMNQQADQQDAMRTFPENAGYTRDQYGPIRIPKKGDVIPVNITNYDQWRVFIEREGHKIDRQGELVSVDGKQITQYTVERDYCFGMGDNRDNSLDSRYWGFIPVENVVGTPLIVYWSWDPEKGFFKDFTEKIKSIRWDRIFTVIH